MNNFVKKALCFVFVTSFMLGSHETRPVDVLFECERVAEYAARFGVTALGFALVARLLRSPLSYCVNYVQNKHSAAMNELRETQGRIDELKHTEISEISPTDE